MRFRLLMSFTVVCFSLLACAKNKPTEVSEEEFKEKIADTEEHYYDSATEVSEDEFKEKIADIEEHYYNSATIEWKKEVTINDGDTVKGGETFSLRAATQEEVDDSFGYFAFRYGFVCEGRNNDGLFTLDVDSYLIPSLMWCSNHLLNGDYILNFYKSQQVEIKYYIDPFKLSFDFTYEDENYHPYTECTYNEYGYATHGLLKKEQVDENNNKIIEKEEATIKYE